MVLIFLAFSFGSKQRFCELASCTAVNWLVPLRCRWQIQQGCEQEKTRSDAKRYKRAVRLCFWLRGSLDYIKAILKSCIVTSGFFHRGIIPLMTSFFLACASKKRLSPHRWNRAMPQGRPLSFILNRMIIKAVYYCFFGRTYGFIPQRHMKSFNGNLHTKEYLCFNQRLLFSMDLFLNFLYNYKKYDL